MNDVSTEAGLSQRLADWVETINSTFGVDIKLSERQADFRTGGGLEVILTPAPPLASLFLTAIVGSASHGDSNPLEYVLSRSLFQRETKGGWFGFESETRLICYQFRWDRYPFAVIDEFIILLQGFISAAEAISNDLKTLRSDDEVDPGRSEMEFNLIRA